MGTMLSSISICSVVHKDSSKFIAKQFYAQHGSRTKEHHLISSFLKVFFLFSPFLEVEENINFLSRIKSCQLENSPTKLQSNLHLSEKRSLNLNMY